jgi:hypothetical protein
MILINFVIRYRMRQRYFEAQVDCAVYANHTLGVSKRRCYAREKIQDAYCDG